MKPGEQKKQIKVLFIEDEVTYRNLISSILRRAGIQCTMCVNGDQAIEKLSKEKFDLILADYLLPGLNGVEVIKWARANKIDSPALILTNFPSNELSQQISAISKAKLIAKPEFDPLSIVKVIQDFISE